MTKRRSPAQRRLRAVPRPKNRRRARRAKKNPSLVVFGANPPRGSKMFGKSVEAIYYIHAEDGKRYVHDFSRKDVRMYALPDGSVLIKAPVRIHDEF